MHGLEMLLHGEAAAGHGKKQGFLQPLPGLREVGEVGLSSCMEAGFVLGETRGIDRLKYLMFCNA